MEVPLVQDLLKEMLNQTIIDWVSLCDNMVVLTNNHRPGDLESVTKIAERIKEIV